MPHDETPEADPRLLEIWKIAQWLSGEPTPQPGTQPAGSEALLDDALTLLRRFESNKMPLRTFFDHGPDGFFFMMLDEPIEWTEGSDKEALLDYVFSHQRLTRANDAMLKQYGAAAEDLIGLTPEALFSHDIPQGRAAWRQLFDAGTVTLRTHEQRRDGTKFWVEGTYVTLHDDQGRVIGHFGTQRDVTGEVETLEALKRSDGRLAEAQRVAHIGLWDWNVLTNDLHWSDEVYRILARPTPGAPVTYDDFLAAVHPEDVHLVRAAVDAAMKGVPYSIEHRLVRSDGGDRWVHERGAVTFDESGKPVRMLGTVQDITDRKTADLELRRALALNAGIVNASPIGIALYASNGDCVEANESLALMLGGTREALLAQSIHSISSWKASGLYGAAVEVLEAGTPHRVEVEHTTTFGRTQALACALVPVEVAGERRLLVMAEDITDRKLSEQRLEASLHEKEVLLQEIHHRVKNNLQIIKSLLHLQQAKHPSAATADAFQESMDRIQVMALLHERLYQSQNLASISLRAYVQSLVESLTDSYLTADRGIRIEVDVDERALDVDRAIPLGLLLTEVVSNAVKHAFPAGHGGNVRVEGRALDSGSYRVLLYDDGVGLPADVDVAVASTLGLKLIRSLARQLGADLSVTSPGGTRFEVTLPPALSGDAGASPR